MVAAVGGLTAPALLYLVLAPSGDAKLVWGVVIGTDTAFTLGALTVVGPVFATQLRVFLLTLTVLDDIAAVSVIGLVYSDALRVPALVVMAGLAVLLALLSRLAVWRAWPFVLVGLGMWLATLEAGLHASVTGMLGGCSSPTRHPPVGPSRARPCASAPSGNPRASTRAVPRGKDCSAPCRSMSACRPSSTRGPRTSSFPRSPSRTPAWTFAAACSTTR